MGNYLVSIIIPVYNGSDYVAKAIESAVNQTYKNLEIIVINDGSKDDGLTKKAVEPFLADPRVQYIEKENGGVSTVLNYGIEHFKGDFFVWLSHDDVLDVRSIELKLKKWESLGSNEKIIISTQVKFINKDGKPIFRAAAKAKNVNNIYDILSSTINGCSLLIPRAAIKGHSFIVGMVYMQDYYLWATLVNEGVKFRVLNKKITFNRVHDKQITSTRFDLLIRDFGSFNDAFIMPLFDKGDFKQIKKITFALRRRYATKPFYKEYVEKYISVLKENKKWNIFDSLHIVCDSMVSTIVKILRRIK